MATPLELELASPRQGNDEQDAACPGPAPPLGSSPRVRLNMTTTIVHFPADGEDGNNNDGDNDSDKLGLTLPASPRRPRRCTVTTMDVCSPEKLPQDGSVAPPPPDDASGEGQEPAHPLPPFPPVAPSDAAAAKKPVPSPQRRVEEEGLGESWASTPWKEPRYEYLLTFVRDAESKIRESK